MTPIIALTGFLLTQGVITWYFAIIHREKVPVSVGPFAGAILAGMSLTAVAVAMEPGILTGILFGVNALMGGGILWLLTQRKLPDGELIAAVGQPMPFLSAPDDTGAAFDLTDLKGKRVMVKFFRGSW